jgi:hypothetical protein
MHFIENTRHRKNYPLNTVKSGIIIGTTSPFTEHQHFSEVFPVFLKMHFFHAVSAVDVQIDYMHAANDRAGSYRSTFYTVY